MYIDLTQMKHLHQDHQISVKRVLVLVEPGLCRVRDQAKV